MLARHAGEAVARSHLQQQPAGLGEQLADAVAEADGMAQVARPVAGIGGLFGRDPGAGDVGQEGDARRRQRHALDLAQEWAEDRFHHPRVEGMGGVQAPRRQAARLQLPGEALDGFLRTCHHRACRRVDRRERQVRAEQRQHLGFRQRHRQHGAGGQRLHQLAARRDQRQGVGQRHDAGQRGRDVLADAVAEQGVGHDPPLHPQPREGVLEHEQRRLGERRLAQPVGGVLPLRRRRVRRGGRRGEQLLAQVAAEARRQQRRAAVDLGAERRLGGIELGAHPGVLGALPGQEEGDAARGPDAGDRAGARRRGARDDALGGQLGERRDRLLDGAADDGAAMLESLAADLQREGHVAEVRLGMGAQVRCQAVGRGRQGGLGARAELQ